MMGQARAICSLLAMGWTMITGFLHQKVVRGTAGIDRQTTLEYFYKGRKKCNMISCLISYAADAVPDCLIAAVAVCSAAIVAQITEPGRRGCVIGR